MKFGNVLEQAFEKCTPSEVMAYETKMNFNRFQGYREYNKTSTRSNVRELRKLAIFHFSIGISHP